MAESYDPVIRILDMVKSILILMLTATQVLAGTCGPRYLCFKADGSFCCVDNGAETCTCCPEEQQPLEVAVTPGADEESCACCHSDEQVCLDQDELPSFPDGPVVSSTDGCGCFHIQVSEGGVATRSARSTFQFELAAFHRDLAVVSIAGTNLSAEFHAHYLSMSRCSLTHSAGTLVDLAWVSIRC